VQLSEGFTGSEIEQAVTDALYDCFDQGKELDTGSIVRAIDGTVPLSITMAEQIKRLRLWSGKALGRKCRSRPHDIVSLLPPPPSWRSSHVHECGYGNAGQDAGWFENRQR